MDEVTVTNDERDRIPAAPDDATEDRADEGRLSPKTRQLLIDLAIGLGLAVLIVLIVIFSPHAEPTFIYQAF